MEKLRGEIMEKFVKLSIIIPVYNVEDYINDCLNSIYKNECKIAYNFEVICIDDCGNDNSIKIINNYIKNNSINNLKVIKHDKNKGLSEARNTGLRIARGDYICFLDSDDMVELEKLFYLLKDALKNDLDIIEGNYNEIFETKMKIFTGKNNIRKSSKIMSGDEFFSFACSSNSYLPMVWTRIYKRKYLLDNKFEFIKGLRFEDEEYTPRVVISANKIKFKNIVFYIYRRRDGSITTNIMNDNAWVKHYLKIIDNLSSFCETIRGKKSYCFLFDRIAEFSLSIYKNPITYGASKRQLHDIRKIVKKNKLYKYPVKSKNRKIRYQGYLMKFPFLFKLFYSIIKRGDINK